MSKRSAFTMAGGLTLALMLAVVVFSSLGLARSTPKSAAAASTQEPIVKTITTTVTIHKKAQAPKPITGSSDGAPVITKVIPGPAAPATSSSLGYHEDEGSGGGGGDD